MGIIFAQHLFEMVLFVRSWIIYGLYSLFMLAFPSSPDRVNAHPRLLDGSARFNHYALQYEDTTQPYFRKIIESLDSFYSIQVRKGFNGSVLIGHDGKVIYERYFGYARKAEKRSWTPQTPSQLASISKTFTATAILLLHENNYLNINQPVRLYLPSFPYPDITIKMLMNHRSGLQDYLKWEGRYIHHGKKPVSNRDILEIFATKKPKLLRKPDTRFDYCNSNYALLACVIERVTAMEYDSFMHRYIFEPLNLNHTFVYHMPEKLPHQATLTYRSDWNIWQNSFADGVVGDKGIYSTPRDLYRWDQSFYRNTLLNDTTLELAYGPCSFERPGIKNYGLGWRMLCFPNGKKVIYHNGWWHGNNTVFYRFIQENLTFIVLGNKYHNDIYHQTKILYGLVTGQPISEGFDDE